jgi:hypothetical protein
MCMDALDALDALDARLRRTLGRAHLLVIFPLGLMLPYSFFILGNAASVPRSTFDGQKVDFLQSQRYSTISYLQLAIVVVNRL